MTQRFYGEEGDEETNSLPQHKSFTRRAQLERLDECAPDERLREKTFLLNRRLCSDEQLEEMKADLLGRQSFVFRVDDQRPPDPRLLLEQLGTLRKRSREPLLHNFEPRGPDYARLFRWPPHAVCQRLFSPVHYRLYLNRRPRPQVGSGATQLASLQNTLIGVGTGTSSALLEAMEDVLAASLVNVVLRRHELLAHFAWQETPEFALYAYFRLGDALADAREEAPLVTMTRSELFEGRGIDQSNNQLGSARTEIQRATLRYIYYAFARVPQ